MPDSSPPLEGGQPDFSPPLEGGARGGAYTLVECRLETAVPTRSGIHLGEPRHPPLRRAQVYDRPLHGQPVPDQSGAKRPMLHAAYLALDQPHSGKRQEWHAEAPHDMKELLKNLAAKSKATPCASLHTPLAPPTSLHCIA